MENGLGPFEAWGTETAGVTCPLFSISRPGVGSAGKGAQAATNRKMRVNAMFFIWFFLSES